ncbi:hypothetical protein [Azohydromonas caseinilytica]|uniref:Uncharacterized protein n=1 Tax=Azohydromonas caseinilytica TaxID=2728836 RepID=A0A848FHK1_9BURK|nr:hypothetical protein [Azohydromonas caseinilytica]NML18325.1 hypothetical protein [Azohydromonas caseinilytica]
MHLPHSARGTTVERVLATVAAALRRVAFGLVGLAAMVFTLLAGLAAAGVLLVVALVARRRLERGGLRFAWPQRGGFRPAGGSRPGRAASGAGEVVDVEVREIRG